MGRLTPPLVTGVVKLDDIIAEDDRVAVRATWRGTHAGEFRGIAATGKTVEFKGLVFWRLCNGKVAERWAKIDFATFAQLTSSARVGSGVYRAKPMGVCPPKSTKA